MKERARELEKEKGRSGRRESGKKRKGGREIERKRKRWREERVIESEIASGVAYAGAVRICRRG